MIIEQLIDLKNVWTENLKFRTYLRDWVVDGSTSWLVSNTADECYKGRLLNQIKKRSLSCQSWSLHGFQVSRSLPAATAADLETPCVCASPSDQPKVCRSTAPRALPLILQSKPLIVLWNSLQECLPDDLQGFKLGFNFELCCLTNGFKRFYLLWTPRIICVELNSSFSVCWKRRNWWQLWVYTNSYPAKWLWPKCFIKSKFSKKTIVVACSMMSIWL